jgi:hypothetical protein
VEVSGHCWGEREREREREREKGCGRSLQVCNWGAVRGSMVRGRPGGAGGAEAEARRAQSLQYCTQSTGFCTGEAEARNRQGAGKGQARDRQGTGRERKCQGWRSPGGLKHSGRRGTVGESLGTLLVRSLRGEYLLIHACEESI